MSEFPLIIDAGHICYSIVHYKIQVESYLAIMNNVCCYYGLFVQSLPLAVILRSDPVIVAALNNHVINLACLDYYDQKIDKYRFSFPCFHLMKQKKVRKFSSLNKINVVICQDYPPVLKTFTLVEEMLITWCHLVMLIFKL